MQVTAPLTVKLSHTTYGLFTFFTLTQLYLSQETDNASYRSTQSETLSHNLGVVHILYTNTVVPVIGNRQCQLQIHSE